MMMLLHSRRLLSTSSHAATASSVKNHMSKQALGIVAVGGLVVFLALAGHKSTIADKPAAVVAPANAAPSESAVTAAQQQQRQVKLKEIKHRVLQLAKKLDAVETDVREYRSSVKA